MQQATRLVCLWKMRPRVRANDFISSLIRFISFKANSWDVDERREDVKQIKELMKSLVKVLLQRQSQKES